MTLIAFILSLLTIPGTFTEPVLHSDYSDPDVICVDGEYWMTSSSFNCIPGLQILHSTDLVNWDIVNAALPKMYGPPVSDVQHGNRVWAPAIRYFNDRFWIFWGDPDLGVFQVHADHPAGTWSEPVQVWKGKGIIDTCPLRDDDGRIYLVHAWAGSRAGFKSVLGVCELDAECTQFISEQVMVFDGNKSNDDTIEGPKFYKRNGWYYIFAPSGGVKEGWQMVLRSKNIYGPYEYRTVLHQGKTDIHGPHQGGWVEDAAGDCWFLHFEDRYAYGRVVHMQPMKWTDDGWCTMGVDMDGDGIGEPVSEYRRPAPFPDKKYPRSVSALETRTDFTHEYIPYNWQWHASPQTDWALMNPSEGCIRLNCIQNPRRWKNLWDTPNLLLEKIVGPQMQLQAKLSFRASYPGDRTGLIVMGIDYSAIELYFDGNRIILRRATCMDAESGEAEAYSDEVVLPHELFTDIHFRVKVEKGCLCTFQYSTDGRKFKTLGAPFKAREGKWIGAKTGFYATACIKKNNGGSVEIY